MVTKGAALVAGGAAIPVDVKRADCNSSRTRLKRAMWKKRALVKAPTEMRLGREVQIQETSSTLDVSKIKLHLSHSTTTWPCLRPRRKKTVKPIAPRSTSGDTEILHVETKTPPTSTGCLRFTFVSNPLPLKKTIPHYRRQMRVATRSNTTQP